jgi:hypothetical protein
LVALLKTIKSFNKSTEGGRGIVLPDRFVIAVCYIKFFRVCQVRHQLSLCIYDKYARNSQKNQLTIRLASDKASVKVLQKTRTLAV